MAANVVTRALAASRALRLPANFTSTHQTAGLPGFPAVDVFGAPGTPVLAPVGGRMVYVHQIPWNAQQRVGGETAYLQGANDRTYFLTHLGGQVPTGNVTAGQQIGTVGAVPQNWWEPHIHEGEYQGIYNPPGVSSAPAPPPTAPADTSDWPSTALLAYQEGVSRGLTPQQAKDFASVQYGESGFDPRAVNKTTGAAGLYQLLSSGYVNRAKALGGVFNPQANIRAILPDYVSYYKSHPSLVPGAAGAAVEVSGQGPEYYARGWQHLPGLPGQTATAPPPAALAQVGTAPPVAATLPGRAAAAPQPNVAERIRSGIVSALLAHGGQMNPQTLLNVALNARRAR